MLDRLINGTIGKNWKAEALFWAFGSLPGFPILNRFRARLLRWSGASVGKGCLVAPGFHLKGGRLISVGDHCHFNRNVSLQASSGARIVFGSDCLVGENVVIRNANHIFSSTIIPIRKQGNTGIDVIIGNDVWIAANVVIIPGARIGDGAVIGAGAVVRGSIPAYSIAVGVPAKVIRSRIVKIPEDGVAIKPASMADGHA